MRDVDAFVQHMRQAVGDPGSMVLRRGYKRDRSRSGDPVESVPRWQLGAVIHVLQAHIDAARDSGPPATVPVMDAFLDGWEAALDHLSADLREVDNRAETLVPEPVPVSS